MHDGCEYYFNIFATWGWAVIIGLKAFSFQGRSAQKYREWHVASATVPIQIAISLAMVWHLDVGLSFPKSVGSLIGGSAHPITRYVSWVQNDVNQFGLYL